MMVELRIKNDCIKCGQCVSVCPAHILTQNENKGEIGIVRLGSCISCGHCVAICPTDSVLHSSFPIDKVHTLNSTIIPSADAVMELLRQRRSNRSFNGKQVPADLLDKILEAANLAPTASNSQTLQYTLITDPETIAAISKSTIQVVDSLIKKLSNPITKAILKVVKPDILGNLPHLSHLSNNYKDGTDIILRGAKALLFIHAPESRFGIADGNLAYQNASIMAESLGVGHFYTGFISAFSAEDKSGIIKDAIGIKGQQLYAGMALGMTQYKFKKYIDKKPQIVNKII